jgi:hypothetical protein
MGGHADDEFTTQYSRARRACVNDFDSGWNGNQCQTPKGILGLWLLPDPKPSNGSHQVFGITEFYLIATL